MIAQLRAGAFYPLERAFEDRVRWEEAKADAGVDCEQLPAEAADRPGVHAERRDREDRRAHALGGVSGADRTRVRDLAHARTPERGHRLPARRARHGRRLEASGFTTREGLRKALRRECGIPVGRLLEGPVAALIAEASAA